jgi:hypothetical protein
VDPFVPLSVNILVAFLLLVAAALRWRLRRFGRGAVAIALLPLLDALLLLAFVLADDTYRDDGTSRWDAYRSPGGALGSMLVVSVVVMMACAGVLAYFGLKGRAGPTAGACLAGGLLALFLFTPMIIGFSAN